MKVGPCKECKSRHIACHANCSLYKEWAAEWEQVKQNRAERLHRLSPTASELKTSYKVMRKFNFHKGDIDK